MPKENYFASALKSRYLKKKKKSSLNPHSVTEGGKENREKEDEAVSKRRDRFMRKGY